jgi:Sulfotransferase family
MTGATSLAGRVGRKAVHAKHQLARRHSVAVGQADPALIFVAGTARSGTTWLAELLLRGSRRRLIFEPFRNDRVPLWSHAAHRQYLRPDDSAPELIEPARKILTGVLRSDWADQHHTRLLTSGVLIKDIAANLMLKWLYRLSERSPFVLVIRHPGGVAASWGREGYRRTARELFLNQSRLIDDHLGAWQDELRSHDDLFDQQVFIWCVETLVPLRQFYRDELLIVFYEDLLLDPIAELSRISNHCGITIHPEAYDRLATPSATSNPATRYVSPEERVTSWRDRLAPRQVDRLNSIIARFGLAEIYDEAGLPRRDVAERFMTAAPKDQPHKGWAPPGCLLTL